MTRHLIACVGYYETTKGKFAPFFIIQHADGTWDQTDTPISWDLKKVQAGAIYSIEGDLAPDSMALRTVRPYTLRFHAFWPNHKERREWVAQSEARKLTRKGLAEVARLSQSGVREVLDDLRDAYAGTPPNMRAGFLAYVINEITRR